MDYLFNIFNRPKTKFSQFFLCRWSAVLGWPNDVLFCDIALGSLKPSHIIFRHFTKLSRDLNMRAPKLLPSGKHTKSYWKWPLIVSFHMKNGDLSIVMLVYQRVSDLGTMQWWYTKWAAGGKRHPHTGLGIVPLMANSNPSLTYKKGSPPVVHSLLNPSNYLYP